MVMSPMAGMGVVVIMSPLLSSKQGLLRCREGTSRLMITIGKGFRLRTRG
jgi:hypothetical protein